MSGDEGEDKDAVQSLLLARGLPTLDRQELYFLLLHFLSGGPCQRTFQILKEEAVEHGLLPSRSDVFGGKHTLTYEQLKGLHTDIDGGFLEDLVSSFVHLRDCHSGHESGGGQKGSSRGREVALPKAVFRQSLLAPSLLRTDIRIKSVRSVARNTVLTGVLARETGEGRIQPHQAATAKLLGHKFRHQRTLRGHRLVVYCLTYDRSGEMLVTGSDDYLVKIWSTVTGHVLASCRGHNGEVTEVSVSCDNKYLASGCVDKTIRVWSLGAGSLGHPVSLLTGHTSVVTDLHFSPKVPSLLLSSSEDGSCRLWNILAPAMPPRILRPNARFALLTATRAAWATQARGGGEEQLGGSPGVGASASPGEQGTAAAPAGTEVVATPAAAVSPEDAQGRRDASSSEAQTGGVAAPAAASAADAAAASGRDAGAQLLAPQMPEAGTAAPGDSSPVMCCQFSPCGEFIVAGSLALGNCAYMWSWDAARFEAERLAAGVEAEAVWDDITLWPPVTEHCRLPVPGSEISFVVFSPQGYFLATAAKTGPIRLFRRGQPGGTPGQSPLKDWVEWNALASTLDVEFVQEVRRKRKGLPDAYVTGLCWTCDERHLVSAVVDRVVRVWDSHTGKLVHLLRGHTDMIHVLCCHPSNARLAASAAYDGHFKLWDIFSGTLLRHINTQHTFPGRGQWACPLALCVGSFSPDGSQIAIADAAGQFHMVGMGAQAPMARAMYDQFFTADYDELVFDRNLEVVDAATQQPPHLRLSPLADYCLHAYDEPYQSAFRTHRASWRAMTAGHSIGQQQSAMATAMEDQRLLNEVYAGDNSPWPQELEKQLEGLPSWVPLERYEQASRPGQAASMQAGGGSGSGRRGQLTQVRVQWEEEGDLGVTISSSEDGDEAGRDAAYVANEGEEEEEDDDSDDHGDRERSMFPDAFLDDVRECDVEDSEEYAEALSASSDDEARAAPSGAGPPGRNSRGERLRRRHARRQNGAGPSNGEAGGRIHGSGRDRRRSRRQVRSRRGGEEHEQERERLRRLREAYPSQFPDWTDSDEEPNDLAAYLSEEEEEDAQAAEGDEEVPGASCRPASAKRRRDNRSARSDSLYSWLQVHSHRPGVYSAQVGDDVVFLRQGYLLFLQQANALRAEQLPWEQVFDTAHAASGGASGDAAAGPAAGEAAAAAAFRPAEACHVNDIQYKIMEDAEGNRYTVPVMELQLVCDSGPMRGRCFNLPLPPPALGHAEFIVLRRRFESGAGARLRIGDMVKNYYLENDEGAEAGSWYCGEIIGDKLNGSPCSDMYACQNLWERFQVRWMPRAAVSGGDEDDAGEDDESGKEEWLSPWELYADAATEEEAYRELRAPEDAAGAFQHALAAVTEVLQDSRFSALHQPPHARAVYRSIRQDRAVPYNSIVPLPFAFSIVHERLVHLYYRSQASLRHDLDTIVQNSELFNGADDGLTQQARQACDYVVALMEKQPGASLGGDGTERRQNGLRESSTSPPHRRGSGDGDDAQGQGKRKRWESEAGPSRRPVPEELAEGPHPAGEGARTSLADANGSPDATPPSRMRKRVRTISLNGMLRGSTPPGRSSSTVIRIRGPSSAPPAPQPSASQPRQRRRPSRQCWRDDDGAEEAADGVDDEEYVEEAEEEEEDEIEDDDVDDDDDLRPASRRRPRAGASSSRRRNQQLSGPSIQPSDGGGRSSARRSGRSRASAPPADHAGRQSLRSRRQPIQRSNDFVDSSLLDMELASDAELSDGPAAPARRRSRARRRRHSPDVSD